jgi:hypothetical protein
MSRERITACGSPGASVFLPVMCDTAHFAAWPTDGRRNSGVTACSPGDGLEDRPALTLIAGKTGVQATVSEVVRRVERGEARCKTLHAGEARVVRPRTRAGRREAQLSEARRIRIKPRGERLYSTILHLSSKVGLAAVDDEVCERGAGSTRIKVCHLRACRLRFGLSRERLEPVRLRRSVDDLYGTDPFDAGWCGLRVRVNAQVRRGIEERPLGQPCEALGRELGGREGLGPTAATRATLRFRQPRLHHRPACERHRTGHRLRRLGARVTTGGKKEETKRVSEHGEGG